MEEKDKQEIDKKRPYTGGSLWDDLMSWAERLSALGKMLETVAWHKNQDVGYATYPIECYGEQLGEIIQDYAELIHDNVAESYTQYIDVENKVVFPLGRLQNSLELLHQGAFHPEGTIREAERHIKEIDAFSENVVTPAMILREEFVKLKKIATNRQKKASDTVMAAAEA